MLRELWACITRAVFSVRQTQALHVGTQETVSSSEPEHGALLVAIEQMDAQVTLSAAVSFSPG